MFHAGRESEALRGHMIGPMDCKSGWVESGGHNNAENESDILDRYMTIHVDNESWLVESGGHNNAMNESDGSEELYFTLSQTTTIDIWEPISQSVRCK